MLELFISNFEIIIWKQTLFQEGPNSLTSLTLGTAGEKSNTQLY